MAHQWGGPEKVWKGTVESLCCTTTGFENGGHPRDLVHIKWDPRPMLGLGLNLLKTTATEMEDDKEVEELLPLLDLHDNMLPLWEAERERYEALREEGKGGRPAYFERHLDV